MLKHWLTFPYRKEKVWGKKVDLINLWIFCSHLRSSTLPPDALSSTSVLFASFSFSLLPILVLALQLISVIVVIDRSLAADELGLAPHESADGTTRVGVIQNDTRLIRDYL